MPAAMRPELAMEPPLVTATAPASPVPEPELKEPLDRMPITELVPPLTARMPKDCTPVVGELASPVAMAPLVITETVPEFPT
ncbi:MAG: hypothetical protein B7X99_20515 [Rhizobiales bacterium 17-65-6]|nr:MAG: hypothetical protein B7X99_20515 [Rhizobiales bacterium 17-65-6]